MTTYTAKTAKALREIKGTLTDKIATEHGLIATALGESNIFIMHGSHDFGASADAVATKISDSAPSAGEIITAFFVLTEAKAGGTADDASCIAKDAAAATKMTGDVTLDMSDTVYMNHLNSLVAVPPHGTEANRQFAKGDDVYAYTAAGASRSAGIYEVIIVAKKI